MNSLPHEVLAIIIAFVYVTEEDMCEKTRRVNLLQLIENVGASQVKVIRDINRAQEQIITMHVPNIVACLEHVVVKFPLLLFKEWSKLCNTIPNLTIEMNRLRRFVKKMTILNSIMKSVLVKKIFRSQFSIENLRINTEWAQVGQSIKITTRGRAVSRYVVVGDPIKLNGVSCIVESFRQSVDSEGPTIMTAHNTQVVFLSELFPNRTFEGTRYKVRVMHQQEEECSLRFGSEIIFEHIEYTVVAININAVGIPESVKLRLSFNVVLMPYGTKRQYAGSFIECPLSEFNHMFAHVFF